MVLAVLWLGETPVAAGPLTEQQILGGAEERIERWRKGDVALKLVGPDGAALPAGTVIEIAQTRHDFLFGCNIFWLFNSGESAFVRKPQKADAYGRAFADLFNFATLPFYWALGCEPERGKPRYDKTDEALAWCAARGIRAKGHPLAWNCAAGTPRWMKGMRPEEALDAQMRRIADCVAKFRGTLEIWDVVNEATEWDSERLKTAAPELTGAIAEVGLGGYLREAFRRAREANPDALLVINDYKRSRDFENRVIKELVVDGRPLFDAIGIQCHQHRGAWRPEEIWENCERFGAHGAPLHWTEATIVSGSQDPEFAKRDRNTGWVSTPEGEARQARDVARFYTTLFSHPAVEAITWWDFSDDQTWKNAPAGLLRADMTPKPAYRELRELVKVAWWTRATATATGGGEARFRGFFGDYKVTATVGAKQLAGVFHCDKRTRGPVEVRLGTSE